MQAIDVYGLISPERDRERALVTRRAARMHRSESSCSSRDGTVPSSRRTPGTRRQLDDRQSSLLCGIGVTASDLDRVDNVTASHIRTLVERRQERRCSINHQKLHVAQRIPVCGFRYTGT